MSAYIIGHITVRNEDKWEEYRSRVPATLEPWRGEIVFRGSRNTVLAGSHDFTAAVVIRFPDHASVQGWYLSPAYQALIPLRREAADLVLVSYD